MNNRLTQIIIMLFASLLMYGGVGVNLVTYCCSQCQDEGISVVMNNSCCEVHDHATDSHSHDEGCCSLERVDFEWFAAQLQSFSFQPMVCQLPQFLMNISSLLEDDSHQFDNIFSFSKSPLGPPGTYLSLLTILLI